ncbi:hypothetical protein Goarm_003983, partial [Gossypium armourianum]|nr:hypothetical protein [Gossypium armourianum]
MGESDADSREEGEEISLLAEELVMLSVKGSKVVLSSKPILICTSVDRDQIRLTSSPYWLKIDSIPPEFDKKDLLHARPLRRGIFVSTTAVNKVWVPFKYENLPMFYFGCGRMGHELSTCTQLTPDRKNKISGSPMLVHWRWKGAQIVGESDKVRGPQECGELVGGGEMNGNEEELLGLKEAEKARVGPRKKDQIIFEDKSNWKRTPLVSKIMTDVGEANKRKRKSSRADLISGHKESIDSARSKRLKHDNRGNARKQASRPDTMKILSWNVCGLGNPRARRRLRYSLKQHSPQMVFLMETKVDKQRMERVRRSCDFLNGIDIEVEGSKGGFYGSPYTHNKSDSWKLLKKLGQDKEFSWLVGGDFNEIMYSFEKVGGIRREGSRMQAFREALEECQLEDLGYSGVWFTWERGNLPETNIRERIDRGMSNDKW